MTEIDDWTNEIHRGDARDVLNEMPESSVHTVVTSPPYYRLRDYGVEDQIGLETSLESYVSELLEIGRSVRRVLRPDGSWWLNLGDTFASHGDELQQKQKMLVPHRVAIGLQDDGWIVRGDCPWIKPNGMPHPVKDRLRETKEFVFHLVQRPDYWFDLNAVREPHAESSLERAAYSYEGATTQQSDHHPDRDSQESVHNFDRPLHEGGKNPGDVFEVPVESLSEAHFAVFPDELVRKPIKAACPPSVCAECGTPYKRVTEEVPVWERDRSDIDRPQLQKALDRAEAADLTTEHFQAIRTVGFNDAGYAEATDSGFDAVDETAAELAREAKKALGGYFREFCGSVSKTTGWEQSCECETDETEPGIVLDPFAGSGTTCVVGKELGRRVIGVDLNPEFVAMAQKRAGFTVDNPELLLDDGERSLAAYTDGGSASR